MQKNEILGAVASNCNRAAWKLEIQDLHKTTDELQTD